MCRMCRRNVGRGPVPRYAAIAGDRPPRYDEHESTVGRGPVPRHPYLAGDRPPRYDENQSTVGRGPVPRLNNLRKYAEKFAFSPKMWYH